MEVVHQAKMEEFSKSKMKSKSKSKRRWRTKKTTRSREMSIEEQKWRLPELTPAQYAQLALEIERKASNKKTASYEFVESLGCNRFLAYVPQGGPHRLVEVPADKLEVGDYCHVSFLAKPKNTTTDQGQVLIFVELLDRGRNEFSISCWSRLEPNSPRVYYDCAFCTPEKNYPHPKIGCSIGRALYDHEHSIAASQSDLAASFKNLVLSLRNTPYKPKYTLHLTLPDPSIFSPELSDDEFAKTALSTINDKEGVDYEVVEILGCRRQRLVISGNFGDWCHMCLIAKPKNDEGLVYFFVELSDPGVKKFSVSTYSRVHPDSATKGCGICPDNENFLHPPIVSYTAGDFPPFGCSLTTSSDEDD